MLIVDAHQDLAWNMLTFGRDPTLPVEESRRREQGSEVPLHNGDTLLGWPQYQEGQVALAFASLFAAPLRRSQGEWDTQCYIDSNQAFELYSAQLDAYYRLVDESADKFRLVQSLQDLDFVLAHWQRTDLGAHPVGLVLLMEGAEAIRSMDEVETWWERGVRLIGPAWAGNRFCGGTREPGPLTKDGVALLEAMAASGFALDLSHMDERAALQALDIYPLAVIASHSNPAALLVDLQSNRFLSDRLLHGLIERDGVVGVVPYNRFLLPGWAPADGRETITLHHLAAHIDYVCQLAGDAYHVGLGSDFDGGFGVQSTPSEIDSIADLQKLAPILQDKGYTEKDIAAIFGGNWIAILEKVLPQTS